ncbi:hypothetical protein HWV62_15905, partial [Athelia sp. TMB]
VHSDAQMASSVLNIAYQVICALRTRDENIDRLVEIMADVYTVVHDTDPPTNISTLAPVFAQVAQQTTECAYFIREYAKKKNFLSRTGVNILPYAEKYEGKLADLRKAMQTGITVLHTAVIVTRVLDTVNSHGTAVDLDEMPYALGAHYDSARTCLPGTRERVIEKIVDWANDDTDNSPRIMLLHGEAGIGKTAIANEIAKRFDSLQRLGSSFFFERSHQADRRPDYLFSTIARDLAECDPQRKACLGETIKEKRSLRAASSVREQFENFILQPALQLQGVTFGPVVIVIDALDESGTVEARRDVLSALADKASELPCNFRILVTARAEEDIQRALSRRSHITSVCLDDVDARPDIKFYIEQQLEGVPGISPNSSWCPWLVDESNGLFQWAFTACSFVKAIGERKNDPVQRLNILASAPQRHLDPLDGLYHKILAGTIAVSDQTMLRRFKVVVGSALAAPKPLPMTSLKELYSQYGPATDVDAIMRPLAALFSGVYHDSVPVYPLHASLREFLTDSMRSRDFCVDLSVYHCDLAIRSLRTMNNQLHFNICSLDKPHLANKDVPDFQLRLRNNVSPLLSHVCRTWAEQLSATTFSPELAKLVQTFMSTKVLFWLEVLSANQEISKAPAALTAVIEWSENQDTTDLAVDIRQFVLAFGSAMSRSIPHIYLSALSAAPQSSKMAQVYVPQLPEFRDLHFDKVSTWPAIQNIVTGHSGPILCMALSPDGLRFATAGSDQAVIVWDIVTGQIVSGPLVHHHTGPVISVAFSHSGLYIASGSEDGMIGVWRVDTSERVGLIQGHSDSVTSIMYSQEFELLVSGSSDCTIRVWDAFTRRPISTLRSHKAGVNCISISPNSALVASASDDKMVLVWDLQTGKCGPPFMGHLDAVTSVAFSADGAHIVSGSKDSTIRMWDISTGTATAVFKGPANSTDIVTSVAFSSNGKSIISGSGQATVQIWDSQNAAAAPKLLAGHTESVTCIVFPQGGSIDSFVSGSKDGTARVWNFKNAVDVPTTTTAVAASAQGGKMAKGCYHSTSNGTTFDYHAMVCAVAYSPDKRSVATGSSDGNFRVWDSVSGKLLLGPIKADSYSVNSVCFSPDGKVLVTGGDDKSIGLWDLATGKAVCPPFKGHKKEISSVMFSPDGARILSASYDKTIRVWDRAGNTIVGPLKAHSDKIRSVAFSFDGKRIVSGSDDIYVWDAQGGRVSGPFKGHLKNVLSVAFSHDGSRVVSGGQDNTVRLWDSSTGLPMSEPLRGHTKPVRSAHFAPGDMIVLSGSADNTIRLWDAFTQETISIFRGHTNQVSCLAFSPDGMHFASGSEDGLMRVRDLWAGELQTLSKGRGSNPFTGTTLLANGWIADSRGELLLWLPPWARVGFWMTRRMLVVQGYGCFDLNRLSPLAPWLKSIVAAKEMALA